MNFINPILLLFAAAASVPLLLHLFNRQRVKVIEFSTVKYLLSLQKTRMRRVKIRQILLLILRTLALLAIAVAFARPTSEGGYLAPLGGKSTTTAIIMMDISGSCLSETNAGSFFERGMETAWRLLTNFGSKEKVTILAFGSEVFYDSGEPTSDFDRLGFFLKTIEPSSSQASPMTVFARSLEILRTAIDPNQEIYLISDLQGNAWRDFEFDLFEKEHLDAKVFLTSTSSDGVENVAVSGVRFPNQIITSGREFSLQGEMTNLRTESSADLLVSLDVNDKKVAQTNLSLPPNGTGKVSFSHTAPQSGFLYGSVTIDDDDLMADNSYHFAMRVPSTSRILLITENDQEANYIQRALAPETDGTGSREIKRLSPQQAGTANLFDFDAVIADAQTMPAALVSALRNYINAGGAVLFLMRSDVDIREYTDRISSPMFGLKRIEPVPEAKAGQGTYFLNKYDFDHPLFSPYKQFTPDKLPQPEFLGHFKTLESASSTVLARFSDNAPAVLEGHIGKGKALLFTFSLDERYSDLIHRPFIVILLNRSVEYLVSEPLNQRESASAGTEVSRELGTLTEKQFVLVSPAGDTVSLSPSYSSGAVIFNLGRLQRPGVYRILGDGVGVDDFAVNFPAEESETVYLEPENLAPKLPGANVILLDYGSDPATLIDGARFGRELWKLFLLLGFVFLMIEMAVASGSKAEVKSG